MQEDVDSMLKELDQWRDEGRKNAEKLARLQGTDPGGGGVEALRSRLVELEEQLSLQRDSNAGLKSSVLSSQNKLSGLISNVAR